MRRSAKSFYSCEQALADLKAAGIVTEVPRPVCYLLNNETVSMERCLNHCVSPCNHFFNFEFVTNTCQEYSCSADYPCVSCLSKIAEAKLIIKVILSESRPYTFAYKVGHKPAPTKRARERNNKLMRRKI